MIVDPKGDSGRFNVATLDVVPGIVKTIICFFDVSVCARSYFRYSRLRETVITTRAV